MQTLGDGTKEVWNDHISLALCAVVHIEPASPDQSRGSCPMTCYQTAVLVALSAPYRAVPLHADKPLQYQL